MAFVPSVCIRGATASALLACRTPTLSSAFAGRRLPSAAHRRQRVVSPSPPANPITTVSMLKEGDKAPSFAAEDTDGNAISLDSLSGTNVVLYFSNGAGPGCTSQSCSFRDAEAQFQKLDARIIAVTAQNKATSISFKQSNGLNFSVIPDKQGTLQKLFGVPATFGLIPGRITFVIDREGVIRSAYNSQFSVGSHISVAKDVLKTLA